MALLYFSLHTHIQVKLNVVCEGRFVGYQTIRAHLLYKLTGTFRGRRLSS